MLARRLFGAVPIFLGFTLHLVVMLKGDDSVSVFEIGLFLASCLPYFFCLVALFSFRSILPAFVGAILAFVPDVIAFNATFVHPQSSTAAIGLLFVPVVNVFLVPIGLLLGWGVSRLFSFKVTS